MNFSESRENMRKTKQGVLAVFHAQSRKAGMSARKPNYRPGVEVSSVLRQYRDSMFGAAENTEVASPAPKLLQPSLLPLKKIQSRNFPASSGLRNHVFLGEDKSNLKESIEDHVLLKRFPPTSTKISRRDFDREIFISKFFFFTPLPLNCGGRLSSARIHFHLRPHSAVWTIKTPFG